MQNTTPKAYLNILFFDEQFNYVAESSGAVMIAETEPNTIKTGSLVLNKTAAKNGYVYMYLSNQSVNTPVYFDDFTVAHKRSPIVEDNAYYPYGLKIDGISAKAALKPQNRFNYQGDYAEEDAETGYNEFALRNFDPQTGRWIQVDPYDEFASPYVGMGNDPVNNVDPDGGSFAPAYLRCDWSKTWSSGTGSLNNAIANAIVYAVDRIMSNPYDWVEKGGKMIWDDNARSQSYVNAVYGSNAKYRAPGHSYTSGNGNKIVLGDDRNFTENGESKRAVNSTFQLPQGEPGSFTDWYNEHMGEYDTQVEAYGAWQSSPGYHPGESKWSRIFRISASGSMEARRDYAGGGYNMFGGYGRAAGSVSKGLGRVFWSGGDEVMNMATSYAKSTGQTTLGMTRAGQNLQKLITSKNIPWTEARPMWVKLSTMYAKGTKGTVHFFGTENVGSIWLKNEKPVLLENGIKIIFH